MPDKIRHINELAAIIRNATRQYMNFDFISDDRFKEILNHDYQELKSCLENKSSKASLILSGSIIEALLIEYFMQNLPTGQTDEKLLKLSLDDLIKLAETESLLTITEKNLASVIKDYRNLIHPGRQIRKNQKYDLETATISYSLVNIIVKAIQNKLKLTTVLTAQEIIDKLEDDWSFRSIYDTTILKLKQSERVKLLNLLIEYEIDNKEEWDSFKIDGLMIQSDVHNLQDNVKDLINLLKPLLQQEIIISKLKELVSEIEKGDKLNAFVLFNCFHEDIDKLPPADQETIVVYFLSVFSEIIEESRCLASEKTYSTIGKYVRTSKGITAFKTFTEFCIVNFPRESFLNDEMDVYEQAFNSLTDAQKEDVVNASVIFIGRSNGYPLSYFESEAITRGILPQK